MANFLFWENNFFMLNWCHGYAGCRRSCVVCATRTKLQAIDNWRLAFTHSACARRTWRDPESYRTCATCMLQFICLLIIPDCNAILLFDVLCNHLKSLLFLWLSLHCPKYRLAGIYLLHLRLLSTPSWLYARIFISLVVQVGGDAQFEGSPFFLHCSCKLKQTRLRFVPSHYNREIKK